MHRINYISVILAALFCLGSCGLRQDKAFSDTTLITVKADSLVSTGYIGNGVQWDPYESDYGFGDVEISEADWKKIYDRLDFMKPAFMRVMVNTYDATENGTIYGILDYCQSRGVTVMFGDWGRGLVDSKSRTVNPENIDKAARLVHHLVVEKGYDCIKYYNFINEPNGDWSSADGNYELWAEGMKCLHGCMQQLGLAEWVPLVAPDVAIWDVGTAWWVSRAAEDMGEAVGLYDIHTYPSKCTVNSGEYSEIIRAYKDNVPAGKKIVMGEIGFKFVEEADSLYLKENQRRIGEYANASVHDSQMFVYDYMYGTDMADALFQTVNEGYSGCVAWMLDDAMHSNEAPDKLKIWGMWNIFGDEIFGSEQEQVRPWYYAWSLLCRHFPAGSDFYAVEVEGCPSVKAVCGVKDGKRTFAMVNVSDEDVRVEVCAEGLGKFVDAEKYVYGEGLLETDGDCSLKPAKKDVSLDFSKGMRFDLKAETMILITELKY